MQSLTKPIITTTNVSLYRFSLGTMHLLLLSLGRDGGGGAVGKGQGFDLELKKIAKCPSRVGQEKIVKFLPRARRRIRLDSLAIPAFFGTARLAPASAAFSRRPSSDEIFICRRSARHVDFISSFPVLHCLNGYPLGYLEFE